MFKISDSVVTLLLNSLMSMLNLSLQSAERAFSVNIIHSFRAEDHVVGFVLTPLKVENVMEGVRR